VEGSCEFGIETSGSIKCWETMSVLKAGDLLSSAQLHGERERERERIDIFKMLWSVFLNTILR
jgi:hypothetical protein